jgi:predicted  nucleic acid-binding Zn-ribbon protein
MSPATAVCARCGHVFSDEDALDACPECGGTERTLRRAELVLDDEAAEEQVEIEERRPDGSVEIVRDPIDEERGAGG